MLKTFVMILKDMTVRTIRATDEFEAHEQIREFTNGDDSGSIYEVR